MKLLAPIKVLILLFMCYSQSIICMEKENKQEIKELSSKEIRKIKKTRKTFDETDYKNLDIPIDLYKEIRTINKMYAERAWLKAYAI